jgi:hypothetical protein
MLSRASAKGLSSPVPVADKISPGLDGMEGMAGTAGMAGMGEREEWGVTGRAGETAEEEEEEEEEPGWAQPIPRPSEISAQKPSGLTTQKVATKSRRRPLPRLIVVRILQR